MSPSHNVSDEFFVFLSFQHLLNKASYVFLETALFCDCLDYDIFIQVLGEKARLYSMYLLQTQFGDPQLIFKVCGTQRSRQ